MAYQTLDELLQLLLGCPNRLLCPNHSDEFLVFVFRGGENDSGTSAVADLPDVSAAFPDEKLVVFWFCVQLSSETLYLLWKMVYQILNLEFGRAIQNKFMTVDSHVEEVVTTLKCRWLWGGRVLNISSLANIDPIV